MAEPDIPGLTGLRAQIDEMDTQLLALLNRRARLSLAVGAAKARVPGAKIYDPEREGSLLQRLSEKNPGPLTSEHVTAIWREILSVSRALQRGPDCCPESLQTDGTAATTNI